MTVSRQQSPQVGTQLPTGLKHGTEHAEECRPLKIKCPWSVNTRLFNCWGRITINQKVPLNQQVPLSQVGMSRFTSASQYIDTQLPQYVSQG